MESDEVFNPLDKRNIAKSIVEALLAAPARALGKASVFQGAGVYAIYYKGPFGQYRPLSGLNKSGWTYPIYVGKAIPKGGRKGISDDASLQSDAMSRRLLEHKASIEATSNLRIGDFAFRCLVVDDVWIPLGESLVIQRFRPLWNTVVEGFGNHDPGGGRYEGKRPLWDELHPGRRWAMNCQPPKSGLSEIHGRLTSYMGTLPFVDSTDSPHHRDLGY